MEGHFVLVLYILMFLMGAFLKPIGESVLNHLKPTLEHTQQYFSGLLLLFMLS